MREFVGEVGVAPRAQPVNQLVGYAGQPFLFHRFHHARLERGGGETPVESVLVAFHGLEGDPLHGLYRDAVGIRGRKAGVVAEGFRQ